MFFDPLIVVFPVHTHVIDFEVGPRGPEMGDPGVGLYAGCGVALDELRMTVSKTESKSVVLSLFTKPVERRLGVIL